MLFRRRKNIIFALRIRSELPKSKALAGIRENTAARKFSGKAP
ncbi:Uncharacterized protein dnm_027230 [Desulfonema magnum]|uniref:Uncharacterized protein n=1 Tax=Desulfonema magnum TaxID=45655 RepID=A0A975GMH7_9BACT|nr:Uncharacterized protein dnm_027230 [Desulfonema magnum]